jgi:hypothetical protein
VVVFVSTNRSIIGDLESNVFTNLGKALNHSMERWDMLLWNNALHGGNAVRESQGEQEQGYNKEAMWRRNDNASRRRWPKAQEGFCVSRKRLPTSLTGGLVFISNAAYRITSANPVRRL